MDQHVLVNREGLGKEIHKTKQIQKICSYCCILSYFIVSTAYKVYIYKAVGPVDVVVSEII